MYTYTHQLRVRYSETDKMGYVYYGHYAAYFEAARVEALRHLGIRYRDLEDEGILMPVLENYSRYRRPAYYDDLLRIELKVKEMPTSRITFDYEIYNEKDEHLHTGQTKLCFLNAGSGRVSRVPESVSKALKGYFED